MKESINYEGEYKRLNAENEDLKNIINNSNDENDALKNQIRNVSVEFQNQTNINHSLLEKLVVAQEKLINIYETSLKCTTQENLNKQ